jgi:diguanylate cyclase (GGDEF)-like protein/PAS domain S-box-containing protein
MKKKEKISKVKSPDTDKKRKKTEEMLHHSEERYRTILENIQESYFEVDLAGNFTFFNDTLCRVIGYSSEELMGMNGRRYSDEEELKKIIQAFNRVYTTGEPHKGFNWQITRKDGAKRYIEGSISLLKDSSGKPKGFRGIAHDITERKKIEERLHHEEQRFRALADQSSDIIVLVNQKGIITYENPAIERVLGFKVEERIGAGLFDLVHPDDLKFLIDVAIAAVRATNASVLKSEIRLRHRDGSWRTFEVTASSLVNDTVIEGGIINLRDITERKLSEEALRESEERHREREERYRNILDNMEEAYYEVDLKGNFTFFNNTAVTNLGYTDNVMMGMNFRQYVDEENASKVLGAYNKVFLTGESIKGFDWELIGKERVKIPVEGSISLMRDAKGNPIGFRGIIRNITERKRAEEEIRTMAIIDTLTGLYNRRGFISLVEQQIKTAVRANKKLLLFFIDLDGLKLINDTWGHEEGDHALKRAAIILKKTFRDSDILSRLGGDEFAALVFDSPELPEVILKRLQSRTDYENASALSYQISMSVGVADYDPSVPCSIDELISRADQLMYNQKKEKKRRGNILFDLPVSG